MPCNLFGPNDNYDLNSSHFFPAIIRKCLNSKKNNSNFVELWGNGKGLREVMYVDDLANATYFFLKKKVSHSLINIGSGIEFSISEYLKIIAKKIGLKVKIKYDYSKTNGTPRKLLDTSISEKYGWKNKITLLQGLDKTLKDIEKNYPLLNFD